MPVSTALSLECHSIGRFTFEDGVTVEDAEFTYGLSIPSGPSDGLVIVCPSLTGTPETLQHWWSDVGATTAQQRYTTLFPHAFSDRTLAERHGATAATLRDLARGIVQLAAALALPRATFVTGGSLGGMLALEVGIESGASTHALVIAAPAVQTAWSTGWNAIQLQALALGGGTRGFALARAVGMMTYRSEQEFEMRFGADAMSSDGRTMRGYLEHHGQRLIERFDPDEYARRVHAMDSHDAGRSRGGWRSALAPHAARLTAVGIEGDVLYSADVVKAWAEGVGARFESMDSIHGHDAFLLERTQMRAIVDAAFERALAAQSASIAR